MHTRRIACFLLGLWLGGGLFMAWVGWQNRLNAARLVTEPHPAAVLPLKAIGVASARLLTAWQAEEQTRFYYETWETGQILLGVFFFLFLLFGTREDQYSLLLAAILLAVTAVQRFWLTPQVSALGRAADFVPAAGHSLERAKMNVLRNAYSVSEIVKGLCGVALTIRFVLGRRRGSSREVRQKLDLIDKANYGHIDR